MKKVKKLLTSTLSLGLALGNMGGTVVEAASALHSIELPVLGNYALRKRKNRKKQRKRKINHEHLPCHDYQ